MFLYNINASCLALFVNICLFDYLIWWMIPSLFENDCINAYANNWIKTYKKHFFLELKTYELWILSITYVYWKLHFSVIITDVTDTLPYTSRLAFSTIFPLFGSPFGKNLIRKPFLVVAGDMQSLGDFKKILFDFRELSFSGPLLWTFSNLNFMGAI